MHPTIETATGRLRGRRHGDVVVYRGVPYARPPGGRRRFRPPEPAEGWTGVRDAAAFGAERAAWDGLPL